MVSQDMMAMGSTYGGSTPDEIAAFETRVGAPLPEAYRQFLLQSNGGRPIDAAFSVEGWGTSLVADFYGIGTGDSCDLDAVRDTFSDVIPKDVVAIGSDPGGNQVCLRLSSGRVGEVLFLDHEDLKRRLRVIAGDFSTFLSDLKPDDYFD